MSTLDLPIEVTFFENYAAATKTEEYLTLSNLAERIRDTSAPRKDALPWLKLARFGNSRTSKGSLRHDANVIAISGIEGDYDAERVAVDQVCTVLEQQGIAAIVYTSPSHAPDAPRWRVLCPFSEEMPPARRGHQLGRLNGLLRGILAHESWTLSQSYYFGSANRNPAHRVEVIDGTPIDQHDDLDTIWLGKPGIAKAGADAGQHVNAETREDCELIRRALTGEGFHVELTALAARYVGRGIPAETVEELLRGIMLSHDPGLRDERWLDRYYSIPDLVASAVRKYRGEASAKRKPVARLARRLVHEGRPPEEIRAAVADQAAALGLQPSTATEIIAWAVRMEIEGMEGANA
jgi:hypothetical protein